MRQGLSKHALLLCSVLLLLSIYVATIEMRPGRLYFLVTYLLFQESVASLLLYLIVFTLSLLGLLSLFLNRNKSLFWAGVTLLFPCLLISLTFRFISGYNFMYADAVLAWNNLALVDTALQNFAPQIVAALFSSTAIIIALIWARKKSTRRLPWWSAFMTPLAAIAVFACIKNSTGVVDDFPAFYRVPLTTIAVITDQLPQPTREPVSVSPVTEGVSHLFFIVDESITATELTLHQPQVKTIPFLYSVRDQLIDFGIASSFTNQSAGSNIALMSGTRLSEIPDTGYTTFSRPNIFQYAQKAGYTTYYIDAQQGGNVLQNFMSPEDLNYIDYVERPGALHPDTPYYQRDMLVADRLAQLAKQPHKVFVYVVKAGAHWPYARTYPPDSVHFSPVLSARSIYKDPERTINTYYNSLRWTVDQFWYKLMHTITPADSTLIIYTSDHGQNFSEAGISLTHASVHETSTQEAAVPLWIWDPGNFITTSLRPKAATGYSHAHIFPTLLQLQGYSPAWVHQKYGNTLLDSSSTSNSGRFFLAGDLFGRGPHSLVPFTSPRPQHKNQ